MPQTEAHLHTVQEECPATQCCMRQTTEGNGISYLKVANIDKILLNNESSTK